MQNENIKQILISIAVGACVAFFSTLFQGLADFLKSHTISAASGTATAFVHLIKTYKS